MADKKISQLTSATTPLAGTEVLPIVQSGSTVKVAVNDMLGTISGLSPVVDSTGNVFIRATDAQATGVGTQLTFGGKYNASSYFAFGGISARKENSTNNNVAGYTDILSTTSAGALTARMRFNSTGDGTLLNGNLIQGTAAKGINFTANTPAAGMTSQLLNWYEEGTFTPVVADAATGGNTGTAALAKGRYTRVGRSITVSISFLDITTTGMTAGNTLFVRGLPFTSVTDAFVNFVGSQANSQLASTNGAIYPVLENNSSAIYLLDGVAAGSGTTLKVSAITSGQTDLYITMTYEAA